MPPKPGILRKPMILKDFKSFVLLTIWKHVISKGLWRLQDGKRRNSQIAPSDTRVFCAKSAEVVERNGDALRSGARERAKTAKGASNRSGRRGWVVKVTKKHRIYGE